MKILLTGMAGFIGMHLAQALAARGHEVIGLDNLSSVNYSADLKFDRLRALGFKGDPLSGRLLSCCGGALGFLKLDLTDAEAVRRLSAGGSFAVVVHLAALAGVRRSTQLPEEYFKSNVDGFFNVLNAVRLCPEGRRPRLIFASSSSVYGDNARVPFSEDDEQQLHPVSVYAACKRMDEIMAATYARLYQLDSVGLRFFTVYGPWGRPDMAPFIFTRALLEGRTITLFNQGHLRRDFTYVSDIVEGMLRIIESPRPRYEPHKIPFAVYNIGCGSPIELFDFVHELEQAVGKKARLELGPMQQGDVHQTYADVSKLKRDFNFQPAVPLRVGIRRFYAWYQAWSRGSRAAADEAPLQDNAEPGQCRDADSPADGVN